MKLSAEQYLKKKVQLRKELEKSITETLDNYLKKDKELDTKYSETIKK